MTSIDMDITSGNLEASHSSTDISKATNRQTLSRRAQEERFASTVSKAEETRKSLASLASVLTTSGKSLSRSKESLKKEGAAVKTRKTFPEPAGIPDSIRSAVLYRSVDEQATPAQLHNEIPPFSHVEHLGQAVGSPKTRRPSNMNPVARPVLMDDLVEDEEVKAHHPGVKQISGQSTTTSSYNASLPRVARLLKRMSEKKMQTEQGNTEQGNAWSKIRQHVQDGTVELAVAMSKKTVDINQEFYDSKDTMKPVKVEGPHTPKEQPDVDPTESLKLPLSLIMILTAKAVGNIYCDIGISPLFVFHALFTDLTRHIPHGQDFLYEDYITKEILIGTLSAVFWILILVVGIKYVILLVQAENGGEGGIFALVSLLVDKIPKSSRQNALRIAVFTFAFLGASCVIGDGVIAPAISGELHERLSVAIMMMMTTMATIVLAAFEGFTSLSSSLELQQSIEPLTIVVLLLLFFAQQYGVDRLSFIFVPVMFAWFFFLFSVGLYNVAISDAETLSLLFRALNPWCVCVESVVLVISSFLLD